ncbi:MAG: endonuclease VII domain-containing protein [Chloroflexota bacterium]|nr:endonuclease VII domain-containing protein [Chloroflexota bacterium]
MEQRPRQLSDETKKKLRDAHLRRWARRRAENPEAARRWAERREALHLTPIISEDRRSALLRRQGGGCGICGTTAEGLVLDHCHETTLIRGLLCGKCNVGLSWFRDDPDLLRRAAMYLENTSASGTSGSS